MEKRRNVNEGMEANVQGMNLSISESTLSTGKSFADCDLPELVVFLQEDSTPRERIEVSSVVNVKLVQKNVSSLVKPDLESSSDLPEEPLEILSSDSSNPNIKQVIRRSMLGTMFLEDEKDIESMRETSTAQFTVRNTGHSLKQFLSDKTACETCMPPTSSEESSKNWNTSKASLQIELGSRKYCPVCAVCEQPPEILTMSNVNSDCFTESSKCIEIQHDDQGETTSFPNSHPSDAAIKSDCPYCRSSSSTASTNSFAFPILTSEWNGSPVRMTEAEGSKLEKDKRWSACFVCCKF